MQAILNRQLNAAPNVQVSALDETSKQVKDLQQAQAKDNEKIINSLTDATGNGLNSNVIKLFKEIQKVAVAVEKRSITADEAGKITTEATGRRKFNTLKPRVDSIKEGAKDFFTMRGFLDKTGIVKRGSGGILSEYLDRNEAKKKYVDQRMKTKGTTFGSRETFAKQFDSQQAIQYDINKNEKEIKNLRENGATDIGLKRSGLLDKRAQLATNLAKVDPSVRPEGFDPKTGKIKEAKPETAVEQQNKSKSAKVIPFTGGGSEAPASLGSEENMLEQNRMISEQSELLKKIEENTRGLKGPAGAAPAAAAAAEESGGFGLTDMLGKGRLGKIAKTAGRGLMSGARAAGGFLMKRAGPLAAVAAVGAGAYEGYQGYNAASDKQDAAKEDIKAKVESGEITQGEANKLEKQVDETATVEKGGAVGKGTGMAIGGAAGALKGAAVGAAIGSVVPIVGTVVGGAIGATVGAIGGSYLGGKGGEWLGKKAGQVKNWASNLFGGCVTAGAEEPKGSSSVSSSFSEQTFAEKDPESYQKFAKFRDEKTQEYAKDNAKRFDRKEPTQADFKHGRLKAQAEAISKFEKEAKAAGALSNNKPQAAEKQNAKSVEGSKAAGAAVGDSAGKVASASSPESAPRIGSANAPQSGNIIDKQSGENEQAKLDSSKGAATANIVSAPTVNNNTTQQNTSIKLQPRNNDSTINRYMNNRYAM